MSPGGRGSARSASGTRLAAPVLAVKTLNALVLDPTLTRQPAMADLLLEVEVRVVATFAAACEMHAAVERYSPDLVVVDLRARRIELERDLRRLCSEAPSAVVVFDSSRDQAAIEAAVRAGASAYVVGADTPERVRSAIDAALIRFAEWQRMRSDITRLERAAQERRVVEAAKALLIAEQGVTEAEAYQRLRRAAMDRGLRIGEIAQELIARESPGQSGR